MDALNNRSGFFNRLRRQAVILLLVFIVTGWVWNGWLGVNQASGASCFISSQRDEFGDADTVVFIVGSGEQAVLEINNFDLRETELTVSPNPSVATVSFSGKLISGDTDFWLIEGVGEGTTSFTIAWSEGDGTGGVRNGQCVLEVVNTKVSLVCDPPAIALASGASSTVTVDVTSSIVDVPVRIKRESITPGLNISFSGEVPPVEVFISCNAEGGTEESVKFIAVDNLPGVIPCSVSVNCGGISTPTTTTTITITTTTLPPTNDDNRISMITIGDDHVSGELLDPISTFTGELFTSEPADFNLGGPMPLIFSRYYAAFIKKDDKIASALGTNWLHNFDWVLNFSGEIIEVVNNVGRVIRFEDSDPTASEGVWNLIVNKRVPFQLVRSGANEFI
ncbi:MAG: DUF6531 domain-containing protein, partial [Candidatus Anammoxibacter sp.]